MSDDASRCPSCGGANACRVADGDEVSACWCATTTFDAASLARVSSASCLCAACASAR